MQTTVTKKVEINNQLTLSQVHCKFGNKKTTADRDLKLAVLQK
jgi:hypothetical protein